MDNRRRVRMLLAMLIGNIAVAVFVTAAAVATQRWLLLIFPLYALLLAALCWALLRMERSK